MYGLVTKGSKSTKRIPKYKKDSRNVTHKQYHIKPTRPYITPYSSPRQYHK